MKSLSFCNLFLISDRKGIHSDPKKNYFGYKEMETFIQQNNNSKNSGDPQIIQTRDLSNLDMYILSILPNLIKCFLVLLKDP